MENASKALIIAGAILISILLITIGIILVRSGQDVAETGTTGMQSQSIQAFNAQFTPYEGIITGAQVKQLYQVVKASNATYDEYFVSFNQPLNLIEDDAKYEVTLQYSDVDTEFRKWRGKRKENKKRVCKVI